MPIVFCSQRDCYEDDEHRYNAQNKDRRIAQGTCDICSVPVCQNHIRNCRPFLQHEIFCPSCQLRLIQIGREAVYGALNSHVTLPVTESSSPAQQLFGVKPKRNS